MIWAIYAVVSAFTLAYADALTKRAMRDGREHVVAWLRFYYALPFLVPVLFFIKWPSLNSTFWLAFLVSIPLEVAATYLYMKALKVSPLSLSLPFLSLTPVFLIGFSYVFFGEGVSSAGAVGIALIACGSYVLNLSSLGRGVLEPFRAITKEKGSLYMLGVAFIFSFTSSLGKVAIAESEPVFFAVVYYVALTVAYLPVALYSLRPEGRSALKAELFGRNRAMLAVGAINAVSTVTHMLAMSMANVAYMISVKRTHILFGAMLGYLMSATPISGRGFLARSLCSRDLYWW